MIELLIYVVGILLAFYMAWGMGANDAANPTEYAVGAGAISMRKAIILFAIFAAAGGILLGPLVMKTVDRGLVPREQLSLETVVVGSFTATLSACIWVTFCTWRGMPISTSHSAVAGVLGFGVIACFPLLKWDVLGTVFFSFIASPFLALLLAVGLFYFFRAYFRKTRKERSNFAMIYFLIYILCFGISFTIFKQILNLALIETTVGAIFASLILSTLATFVFRKMYGKFETEHSLSYLIVIALCFSAFAFGSNDMANAIGVFITPTEKLIGEPTNVTMLALALLGAAGIALGAFTWGYKVINVSAYQVTRLDLLSGTAAGYSNAITVLIFTVIPYFLIGFGMPISTTQSAIGALIGVGLAMKGLTGIDKKTTSKIIVYWLLTIPCVILLSMSLFWLFSHVVGI